MAKIEKLTPDQEAELPIFRQRYLDIATCGGRIDRPMLEKALADAYAEIGKPAPKLFIFDSPAECLLALKIFSMPEEANLSQNLWQNLDQNLSQNLRQNLDQNLWQNLDQNLSQNLRQNLDQNLWQNLDQNLSQNLRQNLWRNLGQNLWQNLDQNLWQNLSQNLRQNLGQNLWRNLGQNLRQNLRQNLWNPNFLSGSQDLYWIAYYRFAESIGCEFTPDDARRLDVMERISTQCEWWWPFENIVVASQRPLVKWDTEGRIHCETGPAIEYRGGYGLHMWRGTVLPEKWIMERATIDPREILKETDVEKKAAGIACIGYDRMFDELNGRIVHDSGSQEIGQLVELAIPGLPQPGRFLRAWCPRNGRIFEGVPTTSEINTAYAAQAWREGLSTEEWAPPPVRT